jgi:glycosyltransferase involved in cell wall biosynthesis
MKFVLILMIRNESKIIERCLHAVASAVDAFCIHDTGSSDNTCELVQEFLKTHTGCLTTSEWKDFGYNRTQSFLAAQDYLRRTGWDLPNTYGILLDADMVFHVESLRTQTLGDIGYTIIQKNGSLEYPNCRLVRMDYNWVCRGVTHEYWDGPTKPLVKSICWIDDKNDGGCKSDKFERDARLLEKGIQDEPENVRYMFYLAQTYHCLGRHKEAIEMYKKRFNAGGWEEERWYSLYMIGQTYLTLGDVPKFEKYMLQAHALRPQRSEPLYKLAKYFREKSQHYKAYHYTRIGLSTPMPDDALFLETDIYKELFRYEETICLFYLNQKRDGLRKSMEYLLTCSQHLDNVYTNMGFYVEPIGKTFVNHPIQRDFVGRDYHPSSVCSFDGNHLVRFVNYSITHTGGYDMKEGNYSHEHNVRTQNVFWSPDGTIRQMQDASIQMPRKKNRILGLEDVRVYRNADDVLRFVATSSEYSDKIRIVSGEIDIESGEYKHTAVIESPLDSGCEKNWIPVNGTHDILYSWNPLRVGHLEGNTLKFDIERKTPDFFRHLRGSAVPIRVKNELWCLVHYVEYSMPRKYFHCIVVLNPSTYEPKRISLPFVFRNTGIEYCLSMTQNKQNLEFIFSSWDDNPMITSTPMDSLEWIQT